MGSQTLGAQHVSHEVRRLRVVLPPEEPQHPRAEETAGTTWPIGGEVLVTFF